MRYDPSRSALYQTERQPPLDPALFAGKPDALAAEFSRLAYYRFEHDPAPLLAALDAHQLDRIGLFHDPVVNSQGFAGIDPAGTAWLVFRGTQIDSFKDALTDAQAWQERLGDCGMVHAGFLKAWRGADPASGLAQQVQDWLGQHSPARIVVTGHSLGGALATLFAAENELAELVTFGSPRVGDSAFANSFAARTARRYGQCADLVTRMPPPLGYAHVGALHYIDSNGAVQFPAPTTRAIASDRRAAALAYLGDHAWRPGNVLLRQLADHAPINYISAVLGARTP